jgi:hypothetical protein
METIKIEILNPKAKKILKNLADLNLINIKDRQSPQSFIELLARLRSNQDIVPSSAEISKEVEKVRSKRYAR